MLELLHRCQTLAQPVTLIKRLRLDAAIYERTPPYSGKGARLHHARLYDHHNGNDSDDLACSLAINLVSTGKKT